MNVEIRNIRKGILNDVDKSKRFLEIGPLCNPLIKNIEKYYTCDIKDTDEVKLRYKDDSTRNIEEVISIDFIMKNSYSETFKDIPKFDYVINSHVFEHIPNPIFFLQDISKILSKKGELIMIIPDKRYCYDYYREYSSFAQMYCVFEGLNKYDINGKGNKILYSQVLDSFSQQCASNDSKKFWKSKEYQKIGTSQPENALKNYENFKTNEVLFDRHFWCFSDFSFLKILYNLTRYTLLPFKVKEFFPTRENTFAFGIILEKDEKSLHKQNKKDENLKKIYTLMNEVLNYNESLKNKKYIKIIQKQEKKINKIQNSKSWKITKPLRKIINMFFPQK